MSVQLKQFERAGCGAMALVFRGALTGERGTSRKVAIKRLRPELAEDPAAVELFVNEARISVRLDHPNVVHALELRRDELGYALVCEWLECTSLAELVERGIRLPPFAVVHVGCNVAQALDYLHNLRGDDDRPLGLVHRDVTPANVFLTRSGQVKLGDFGVAWCAHDRPTVGATAGTPAFAAPEQLAGRPEPRSDLYGLGATLRAVAAELPADLRAVLERACADNPAARFATAAELGAALEQLRDRVDSAVANLELGQLLAQANTVGRHVAPQLDNAVQSLLGPALAAQAHDHRKSADSFPGRRPPRRGSYLILASAIAVVASVALWLGVRSNAHPEPPGAPPLPADKTQSAPPPLTTMPPAAEPSPSAKAPAPVLPVKPLVPIQLNAIPWARVSLDGRLLGNTPLKEVQVTAGRHKLLFEHPPGALRREVFIDVVGQGPQTFVVDLRSGTIQHRKQGN